MQSKGLSFGSILFFIFLVMKLMHYIDWSWWWVTAPLWLPITAIVGILGCMAIVAFIFILISAVIVTIIERRR